LCLNLFHNQLNEHFRQLFVMADTQGRARAKVKHSLGAVGFALTVFPEKHV
jgi:hypothetical protein